MRGRLWLLWSTMTFGGLFTCLIGIGGDSFGMTIAFVILAATGIEVLSFANLTSEHSGPYIHSCLP